MGIQNYLFNLNVQAYDVVYFQTEGDQPSELSELPSTYKITFGF